MAFHRRFQLRLMHESENLGDIVNEHEPHDDRHAAHGNIHLARAS